MHETKTTLLLSACLFLHAHVLSERNPSAETQNLQTLSDGSARSDTISSNVLRKTANASKSVQSGGNTPISAERKLKEASVAVANAEKAFETASSKADPNDAFRDADRLEEQTDAVTAMLQQQLFAPHDGNLILQAVKKLPQNEQTSASVEAIAAELKVRLSDALRKICPYDTHALDTLTLQLADVIRAHGIRQKRPFALFNPEDIRYLTAGLYHVLQETDIQQLIVF
ncbi:MAG: hypothetical protein IJ793_00795 [Opitutales bacterium]|nr:hypothetical protein [Opitutales bacterium]